MSSSRPPRPRSSQVAKAAQAGEGSKKIWLVAAVVAVVAFAGIIAVALSQESGSDGGDEETASVEISGDALSSFNDEPAAAVGQPAPELSGTSIEGEPMSIENDGRPKVVAFLAHWCPHCQAEVPIVQRWVDDGGLPDGVDLVTVSTAVDSRRPNYPPAEWLAGEGWTAPVLVDGNNQAADAAGLTAFPFFVAVDGQGNVVERTSGELPIDQLTTIADELAAGSS